MLFQQSPFLFMGLVTVIAVVSYFFWDRVDHALLLPWLLLSILLTIARVILITSFNRKYPAVATVKWGYTFAMSSAISGMLWGSASLLFLNVSDSEAVLLLSVSLTGMLAGSLVPLSVFNQAFYAFSIFSLSPFIYKLISSGQELMVLIGYMVMVYLIAMLAYSHVVNKNIIESIKLRFQNIELMENLQLQKEIAEKANVEKSRFLAATSHDLRQPLHAMDLFLGALGRYLKDDYQKELFEKVIHSSRSLTDLLNSLMDVSRLDAGVVDVNLSPVKLQPLLDSIAEDFKELANQSDIELSVNNTDLLVLSDPILLARIIRNLVSNAVKHNSSCKVSVRVKEKNDELVIEVYDSGKGIAETEKTNIFSEFYQLDNPERDRNKGLGLGLAIVKRLSHLLNYSVKVESEIGIGSCFSFCVPLYKGKEFVFPSTDTVYEELQGLFVLVIDDEVNVRDAIRALLRSWDCESLICDSEESALQQLREDHYQKPNLIISDYRLRDNKTGVEAISSVRDFYNDDIPSIIVTGDTAKEIVAEAVKIGSEVLYKPLQSDDLRLVMQKTVSC